MEYTGSTGVHRSAWECAGSGCRFVEYVEYTEYVEYAEYAEYGGGRWSAWK